MFCNTCQYSWCFGWGRHNENLIQTFLNPPLNNEDDDANGVCAFIVDDIDNKVPEWITFLKLFLVLNPVVFSIILLIVCLYGSVFIIYTCLRIKCRNCNKVWKVMYNIFIIIPLSLIFGMTLGLFLFTILLICFLIAMTYILFYLIFKNCCF